MCTQEFPELQTLRVGTSDFKTLCRFVNKILGITITIRFLNSCR